jgi:transcriptional regulator with XRE-family HTH domain
MAKGEFALGMNVKRLREKAGISQQYLATLAGLSMSAVSLVEQGKKPDPRLSTAVAIADALGVTVDELIGPRTKGKSAKKER